MSREIEIRKEAGEKLGIDLETYHTQYNKPKVSLKIWNFIPSKN